jgi:RND family efflux transporter MFP subunit
MDEKQQKKHHYRILTIAVSIVGVITAIAAVYAADQVLRTVQSAARLAGMPVPVQTEPAKVESLNEIVGASGMVEPSNVVNLTAGVVGRVLKVSVDLGVAVKRGDTLVELDPRLFLAKVAASRADYEHAKAQLERTEALLAKRFATRVDFENARCAEEAARNTLVRSEIDLENTRLISPVAGVVLQRSVNPGEITKNGQPMIQLGVLEPSMMVAQVPEDRIDDVYIGMKAVVGTDAFPGQALSGSVRKIDFKINQATRTFGVYVQLDDAALKLKKGVTGYCRLESKRMALGVPDTAVINPVGDRAAVFVIDKKSTAHMRQIRRGSSLGGTTEVLSGLQEGEVVVTVGQFNLHDDDRVSGNKSAPWNKREGIRAAAQ